MSNYIEFKKWKQKNHEQYLCNKRKYQHRYPGRRRFTSRLYVLVKTGRVHRQPCRWCGSTEHIQGCTASPSPYDVWWFCDSCNKKFHRQLKKDKVVCI